MRRKKGEVNFSRFLKNPASAENERERSSQQEGEREKGGGIPPQSLFNVRFPGGKKGGRGGGKGHKRAVERCVREKFLSNRVLVTTSQRCLNGRRKCGICSACARETSISRV
jgi:hypothetical protein